MSKGLCDVQGEVACFRRAPNIGVWFVFLVSPSAMLRIPQHHVHVGMVLQGSSMGVLPDEWDAFLLADGGDLGDQVCDAEQYSVQ